MSGWNPSALLCKIDVVEQPSCSVFRFFHHRFRALWFLGLLHVSFCGCYFMQRCWKQLNSHCCRYNLRGKAIIKLVIQKQGCFVVQLLHDPKSILTTDPVNLDLSTSSRVTHCFQRLTNQGPDLHIYIWTPAAEQRDPFRRKRTEAQRRHLPGDAWIIWEGSSSGSGGVYSYGQVVPGGGAGANPLCPLHAGDTQQLPCHPVRL